MHSVGVVVIPVTAMHSVGVVVIPAEEQHGSTWQARGASQPKMAREYLALVAPLDEMGAIMDAFRGHPAS